MQLARQCSVISLVCSLRKHWTVKPLPVWHDLPHGATPIPMSWSSSAELLDGTGLAPMEGGKQWRKVLRAKHLPGDDPHPYTHSNGGHLEC